VIIGRVAAIFRYPIKSMACEPLADIEVGWHGLAGDRRFALHRVEETGGKPWLTASKLPELLRFTPVVVDDVPVRVRTPEGDELAVGDALAGDISRRHGKPVQLMRLDNGIFDEGAVSIITPATIAAIGAELDVRRFRPNILIHTDAPAAFEEDAWVGSTLAFGDGGPEIAITLRDERCAMLNLDPDTAESDPRVLKAAVRLNDNQAGVYGAVTRRGRLAVGQVVFRVTSEGRADAIRA
jgi:uncharacterized protein YcbX